MDTDEKKKISYRRKEPLICPVCGKKIYKEELFSGGGRLIAGNLTPELRRNYEDSRKFGRIIPLIYQVSVCPDCLFAAYPADFKLEETEQIQLSHMTGARQDAIKRFFGHVSFDSDRDLVLGAASYMLAVDCYSRRKSYCAPTFKNAVSSLRAAWLFSDLAAEKPESSYKKISYFFYKKAYQYYMKVLELIQNGAEPSEAAGNMGPDTDKNWGYEGILYIAAVLTVKVGVWEKDLSNRTAAFTQCKKYLSRLFGTGKSSKSRPGELLDKTRDLYNKMNAMLEEWGRQTDPEQSGGEQ